LDACKFRRKNFGKLVGNALARIDELREAVDALEDKLDSLSLRLARECANCGSLDLSEPRESRAS
jgi:hypothetical protein